MSDPVQGERQWYARVQFWVWAVLLVGGITLAWGNVRGDVCENRRRIERLEASVQAMNADLAAVKTDVAVTRSIIEREFGGQKSGR